MGLVVVTKQWGINYIEDFDMYYAGIGSRETPDSVLVIMNKIGAALADKNCVLRSGGAQGADSYFESGVDSVNGAKEIYLPWNGFNGKTGIVPDLQDWMLDTVNRYHPAPDKCSGGARKLHARNACQILGLDGQSPSDFVVCWTKDGRDTGGTGQALRIAAAHGIPIYNLFSADHLNALRDFYRGL